MTWTLSTSGTSSGLTIGTEVTLGTDTTNGTFVLEVDASNMVAGDALEARMYTITLAAGALVQAWKGTFFGGQINKHKLSPSVASDQSFSATLNQRSGGITIAAAGNFGSIFDGSYGVGVTTGAVGIIRTPGGTTVSSGAGATSLFVTMTSTSTSNSFGAAELVNCSTGAGSTVTSTSNQFTMNAAATGRTYSWKVLRI